MGLNIYILVWFAGLASSVSVPFAFLCNVRIARRSNAVLKRELVTIAVNEERPVQNGGKERLHRVHLARIDFVAGRAAQAECFLLVAQTIVWNGRDGRHLAANAARTARLRGAHVRRYLAALAVVAGRTRALVVAVGQVDTFAAVLARKCGAAGLRRCQVLAPVQVLIEDERVGTVEHLVGAVAFAQHELLGHLWMSKSSAKFAHLAHLLF